MDNENDFLDEMVAERTAQNPEFPRLLHDAVVRRKLARGRDREHDAEYPPATDLEGAPDTDE